jgi:succinate-acetate transporter protein
MGIFYGGVAQIIAGVMEWRKNNTFGTLAFTSYGLFWLTLAGIWLFPTIFDGASAAAATSETALAWFFVFWGLFTAYLFVGTLKLNRALQVVFGLLTILFFLLAARDFGAGDVVGKIAGYEGILTGLSAIYAAMAQILNETYKRVLLPLGPVSQLPKGFVQDHGEEIASMWLQDLRQSAQTASYNVVSDEELVTASEFALSQVDEHFSGRPAEGDIAAFFHKLGATRAAQGLPLPELISAILLLKREIWMTARTHGVWESAMDLQRAVDLNRELGRFFDRAVYHAAAGYTGYPFRARDAF